MKKILKDEWYVKMPIVCEDLWNTEYHMLSFFGEIISWEEQPGGYPRWNDSVDQLMEVAHVLARMRRIQDPATGRPMTMRAIATRLGRNLHRRCPQNIYAVARQSLRSKRPDVVTYYTRLRLEGGVSLSSFVDTVEPISLPRLDSYRGVFDGGNYNG